MDTTSAIEAAETTSAIEAAETTSAIETTETTSPIERTETTETMFSTETAETSLSDETTETTFSSEMLEHVKQQLCTMADIRFLLSLQNFCPRHRLLCFNPFCLAFTLLKVVGVSRSWKARRQSVFIYKSTHNE
ncbi:hypothetical protein PR002_g6269 [Phytophthora rubi]|uniref:Uncharacterized protein n=1 Tax=Phytophthora rubi TaxID=129364 RepID=A0A6A3N8E2_9STRA|nr:hypothetical protein PR002_g6269 [Phytophthora rubi]